MRALKSLPVLIAGVGLAVGCYAQTTPNLHLNTPFPGAPNWGVALNANFNLIDTWSATVCPKSACTLTGPLTAFSLTSNTTLQVNSTCPGGSPNGSMCAKSTVLAPQPLATFQAASSANLGRIQMASDGVSATDCTIGGGASTVPCINTNGAVYTPLGGGAGATTIPYLAAIWDDGSLLAGNVICGSAAASGTIQTFTLMGNGTTGSATVDVSTETFAQWLAGTSPTSITNGHPLSFAAAKGVRSSTFAGWTTTVIAAGNVYCFTPTGPASIIGLTATLVY